VDCVPTVAIEFLSCRIVATLAVAILEAVVPIVLVSPGEALFS
jgi:hypothetical protein